jgi:hypothetical protein
MLAAAKQETFSASGDPRVCFSLAVREGVGENSRLGFARKNAAPHQGSAPSKLRTALRDRGNVARNSRRMSLLPQSPLRPPTQQQYNTCMQNAASTRNSAILNARGEQAVGGLLTLIGVGTAAYSLPALGEGFFNEGAAGLVDFAHAGGFAYFGALGPLGAGVGVFGKGTYDVANAWNQYYANTISCAASHP